MHNRKRNCSLCGAVIPEVWDNEAHYGTCPSCHRGAVFVLEVEDEKKWEEEENQNKVKNSLLTAYNVIQTNKNSGIQHVNHVGLAKLIKKECGMHFLTIEDIDTDKQELFYYKDGFYQRGGINRIKEKVQYFLDELSSIHAKNEVVDEIAHTSHFMRDEIEPPVNLINLKNGIYNIDTGKIIPHSPEYYFLNQIPVDYKKKADCPKIKKFFTQVIYPEHIPLMQELFGFILYRKYLLHKAFMFYGGGRNGKGTTVNLIQRFVGKGNYSSRSLIDIMEDRFAKASLYSKLCNLAADISGKAIVDTGVFKNLTGGEPITGEQKYHGAFNFVNYAKLIFNANIIPVSKNDKSTAFFQRWIIISFPKTFEMGDTKTDPNIFEKISTEEEMSGLFNWAIIGLKRLLKNNSFTYYIPKEEDEIAERYELLTKPDMRFIKDTLMLEAGAVLPVEEAYSDYEKWAESRMYPIITKTAFSRSMKRYTWERESKIRCEIAPKRINGKLERCYINVRWKDEPENGLRFNKNLDGFSNMPLNKKIEELKKYVEENDKAGFSVTLDFLYYKFDAGFINQAVQSGLLHKKPDGTYTFK